MSDSFLIGILSIIIGAVVGAVVWYLIDKKRRML